MLTTRWATGLHELISIASSDGGGVASMGPMPIIETSVALMRLANGKPALTAGPGQPGCWFRTWALGPPILTVISRNRSRSEGIAADLRESQQIPGDRARSSGIAADPRESQDPTRESQQSLGNPSRSGGIAADPWESRDPRESLQNTPNSR